MELFDNKKRIEFPDKDSMMLNFLDYFENENTKIKENKYQTGLCKRLYALLKTCKNESTFERLEDIIWKYFELSEIENQGNKLYVVDANNVPRKECVEVYRLFVLKRAKINSEYLLEESIQEPEEEPNYDLLDDQEYED